MSFLLMKVKELDGTIIDINDAAAQAVESNRLMLKGKSSTIHWPRQEQYSLDDRAVIEGRKPIFRCEKSRFLDRELDVLVGKFPIGRGRGSSRLVLLYFYQQPPTDFHSALRESGAVQNPKPATAAHIYSVLIRPIHLGNALDEPFEPAECQLIQRNLTIGEAHNLQRFIRPAALELGFIVSIAHNNLFGGLTYEITSELRERIYQGQHDRASLNRYKQAALTQLSKRYFPV